jgi:prevent-host-death family protein
LITLFRRPVVGQFRVNAASGKRQFGSLLDRVSRHGDRIVIVRRGTPVAALVPLDDIRPGKRTPRVAGTIPPRVLNRMRRAIEEECEKIESEAW